VATVLHVKGVLVLPSCWLVLGVVLWSTAAETARRLIGKLLISSTAPPKPTEHLNTRKKLQRFL
jgi:hypothetical protein